MEAKPESRAVKDFREYANEKNTPVAVAAIKALAGVISRCVATTMMGLQKELDAAALELRAADPTISLISGTELFLRFVTRASTENTDGGFEKCKDTLVERANKFLDRSVVSREAIGKLLVERLISDGMTVLVHGLSRVVLEVLRQAAERGKRLRVLCCECRTPTRSWGHEMATRVAQETGFPVSVVVDAGVARVMSRVSMVLFGAEGVVENGGIINTVGTFQIAMVASSMRVPVYVAAESFKFVRHFPLSQEDVPQVTQVEVSSQELRSLAQHSSQLVSIVQHTHDYTPPKYITLLFTDLGILTPAAVSDQLIKLYL